MSGMLAFLSRVDWPIVGLVVFVVCIACLRLGPAADGE